MGLVTCNRTDLSGLENTEVSSSPGGEPSAEVPDVASVAREDLNEIEVDSEHREEGETPAGQQPDWDGAV